MAQCLRVARFPKSVYIRRARGGCRRWRPYPRGTWRNLNQRYQGTDYVPGGISSFSPLYGSVCDNVENFDVHYPSTQSIQPPNPLTLPRSSSPPAKLSTQTPRHIPASPKPSAAAPITVASSPPSTCASSLRASFGAVSLAKISARDTPWFDAFASFTGDPNHDPYAALINSYVWSKFSHQPMYCLKFHGFGFHCCRQCKPLNQHHLYG